MNTREKYPAAGDPIDLANFGAWRWWSGAERQSLQAHPIAPDSLGHLRPVMDAASGEWHLGLEWNEPRDVSRVVVEMTGPIPPDLRLQYWQKNWPTPAPERLPGARRGWIGRDDPWHGRWVTAKADKQITGTACAFTFDPIDWTELRSAGWGYHDAERLGEIEHYLARFRRTLKLRLVSRGETCPVMAAVHAYAPAAWQEVDLSVQFEDPSHAQMISHQQVQVTNGYLLDLAPGESGARLRLLYTPDDPASSDGTVVTLETGQPFSFLASDAARGPVYIKEYGVLVAQTGAGVDLASFRARLAANPRPIYDRIAGETEQSLERAMAEIPRLDVTKQEPVDQYVILGVEAGRQEFALRYNGELYGDKRQLKLFGRDSARLLWPGSLLRFRFGTGDPPDFRERRDGTRQEALDGWLPVFTGTWLDREIEYRQTAFAALLDGPMTPPEERSGEENVVVMMRFTIRNTTQGTKRARLWLAIAPQEQIEVRGGLVLALGRVVPAAPVARQWRVDPYETPYLRTAVETGGRGTLSAAPFAQEAGGSAAIPSAAAYDVDLEGGEAHTITLAFPFITLTRPEEWRQAAGIDYADKLAEVVAYWRGKIEAGGQVNLPEPILNDFHKAARAHVALSVDKDPASGLITVPAAAWSYGSCGNEACWQISMLDQAGHHEQARSYLQTFLDTQGWLGLDGNFSTTDGVLQGIDLDEGRPVQSHFSYNTDHGFIMECLADHYRYTGDRDWLEANAAKFIAACDFVIRERKATQHLATDGRPAVEWGLLPAGHLEDNPEWRYWFAVNAHAYNGMQSIASVLAEIGHPDAPRLTEAASAYQADIRQAARRAMVEAPVVRLLDGSYIPRIPTRTGLRGREWGWFREAAYGAIHLLECNVFAPDEPEMTWVIQDLEDNLYPSREWGRPVDLEKYWFSHGGDTIQPSLTDFAIDYLRRGQVKHGLRALFNHFAASIYPDVRVFTEHPVVELGHGVGPFYKTSDESKWLVWLRAFLLREEGSTLHLAPGAPRAWFAAGQAFGVQRMASFFGPLSYRVEADLTGLTIQIDPPVRRPPREIVVHLRRGETQAIQSVLVNGLPHPGFDPQAEVIRLAAPGEPVTIVVTYA